MAEMTKYQKDFITNNVDKMSVRQMAKRLKLGMKNIEDYIVENSLIEDETIEIKHKLRRTKTWDHLQDELSPNELEFFEEKYSQYISQFKDDVLVTEETQIFILIKLEIMMHRNSKAKKNASSEISRVINIRDKFIAKFADYSDMEAKDRDYVLQLDTQIQAQKTAEAARSGEFIKLEEKHQALLKDLKATRDQRVSRVESSRESFIGIIKKLQSDDEREATGRHMELMKKVSDREKNRLGRAHTFVDGNEDLPILNAETINAE